MPQVHNWKENALIAVSRQLPEIAKQLRIANKLKALELSLKFGARGFGKVDDNEIDKILED